MKLAAAAIYFLSVFGTGFVVGPIRVLLIEPRVGPVVAVLLEAPILLLAMFVGANYAVRWSGLARSGATLLGVGFVALVLQQCADVAVGVLLRGMSLMDFATASGMIYGVLLIAFALLPLIVGM